MDILILRGHKENLGGVANFYNNLLPQFRESIFSILFLRYGAINNCKLHRFKFVRFLDVIYICIKLIYLIKRKKIQLVHFNPSLDKKSIIRDAFLIYTIRKFYTHKIKIISFFHGWQKKVERNFTKNNYLTKLTKSIVLYSDAIIVLADEFKIELSEICEKQKKIYVLTTSIDTKQFNNVNRFDKQDNIFNILFLSRIIREKGIYEIAQSIHEIVKNNKKNKIMFNFVGDGEELPKLKKYIIENRLINNVKFWGYLRGKEKIDILRKNDIFIFPSYSEGCPVSVLEAMASGLPIISTNVGCLGNIIKDGVNGYIIRPQNVSDIIDKVNKLINNPKLRLKMSLCNIKKANEEFDNEVVFKKIERIYYKVLDMNTKEV